MLTSNGSRDFLDTTLISPITCDQFSLKEDGSLEVYLSENTSFIVKSNGVQYELIGSSGSLKKVLRCGDFLTMTTDDRRRYDYCKEVVRVCRESLPLLVMNHQNFSLRTFMIESGWLSRIEFHDKTVGLSSADFFSTSNNKGVQVSLISTAKHKLSINDNMEGGEIQTTRSCVCGCIQLETTDHFMSVFRPFHSDAVEEISKNLEKNQFEATRKFLEIGGISVRQLQREYFLKTFPIEMKCIE
eukprot:GDKJ01028493.1.p1 GENE.GDKJ01028493.1~~GDKJ01028493.1.p1  ORF type:complete len:243 (-),score=39.28 GDKJ01028493.1:81-809(-)